MYRACFFLQVTKDLVEPSGTRPRLPIGSIRSKSRSDTKLEKSRRVASIVSWRRSRFACWPFSFFVCVSEGKICFGFVFFLLRRGRTGTDLPISGDWPTVNDSGGSASVSLCEGFQRFREWQPMRANQKKKKMND